MHITKLYEVQNGQRRLMNTIDSGSRFHSIPQKKYGDLLDPDNQLEIARDLKEGWVHNGNKPDASYEIWQSNKNGKEFSRIE